MQILKRHKLRHVVHMSPFRENRQVKFEPNVSMKYSIKIIDGPVFN
jgi:hypothetical protein